jgi:hypothetical protein
LTRDAQANFLGGLFSLYSFIQMTYVEIRKIFIPAEIDLFEINPTTTLDYALNI